MLYELLQFLKRIYEKHERKKRDDEIEEIKKDSVGAWDKHFGSTDSRVPSIDDAASTERSLSTSDTKDATSRFGDTNSNAE